MFSLNRVQVPNEALAAFCRRNGIRRLSLFGSVVRDDFRPESDIDVLVEFEPGVRVGLRFFDMEQELCELFGRKVDLNTPGFLSKYFRDEVLTEAVVQYDATVDCRMPIVDCRLGAAIPSIINLQSTIANSEAGRWRSRF